MSYSADIDDFAMTYENFMNALEIKQCSETHPVSRAKNGNTKKVVIARRSTKDTLSLKQFSTNFDIYYHMVNQLLSSGG